MKFKRILLKLSGEALNGSRGYGIDHDSLKHFSEEIKSIADKDTEIAIVIGGGNIFRGLQGASAGFDRITGDYMGMLATVINSMALQSSLENIGIETVHLSGLPVDPICQSMSSREAIKNMEEGKVVIISGGTGNPFFTTDTAAVLRGLEIKADVILKGTRVDGVYDEDPEKKPDAIRYDTLSFDVAIQKGLNIMDITAFTLCKDNKLPIIVFNITEKGNLSKIIEGDNKGTLVSD